MVRFGWREINRGKREGSEVKSGMASGPSSVMDLGGDEVGDEVGEGIEWMRCSWGDPGCDEVGDVEDTGDGDEEVDDDWDWDSDWGGSFDKSWRKGAMPVPVETCCVSQSSILRKEQDSFSV